MATERVLTHEEAKAFYDRLGRKQDLQRFFENAALESLLTHADFEHASAVVEFGCGTGRLAAELLQKRLPRRATYVGFDVSTTMTELARHRVEPWSKRARVEQTDGSPILPLPDASCDRFLSTYVLDLLSEHDIRVVLREARRLLRPEGRLCLLSLTHGESLAARTVCRLWQSAHSLHPRLVGGCRPLKLATFLGREWRVLHRAFVSTFGMCSEVVVAQPA